jgi:hypothetical protein
MTEDMEACFCECDWDGDPPEWFKSYSRKARKLHSCCECGAAIVPGDRYQYNVGKWGGIVEEFKTCLTCAAIRADYCAPLGMLRETLQEFLGIDYLGEREPEDDGD